MTADQRVEPRTCAFGPIVVSYDDRVLAPRHWTLLQSEWAADAARISGPGPLLELFAGAGHIGLVTAILAERPIIQVEADATAARYAAENAERAGQGSAVEVRKTDVDHALRPDERFSVIIADPPYLPTEHVDRWPGDPILAIDGGPDGLAHIPRVLRLAVDHLHDDGWLLLQVAGVEQAAAVVTEALRTAPGLRHVETRCYDVDRGVVAFRRTETDQR